MVSTDDGDKGRTDMIEYQNLIENDPETLEWT